MPIKQQFFFKNILNNCNNYMEFGSGGSTIYASNNVKNKVLSFESDELWINKIKSQLKKENVNIIHIDIETKNNNWGYPGKNCSNEKKMKYSTYFKNYIEEYNPDVILIDGRFRVSCALQIFDYINNNTKVLFDDFLNRDFYHEILNYYDIVNKVVNLVELKKKININIPDKVKQKYLYDPR